MIKYKYVTSKVRRERCLNSFLCRDPCKILYRLESFLRENMQHPWRIFSIVSLGQEEFSLEYVLKAESIEHKKNWIAGKYFWINITQNNWERKILAREIWTIALNPDLRIVSLSSNYKILHNTVSLPFPK